MTLEHRILNLEPLNNTRLSASQIADLTQINRNSIGSVLNVLKEKGLVEKHGTDSRALWCLSKRDCGVNGPWLSETGRGLADAYRASQGIFY